MSEHGSLLETADARSVADAVRSRPELAGLRSDGFGAYAERLQAPRERLGDLLLAWLVLEGHPRAVAIFDTLLVRQGAIAGRRLRAEEVLVDEVAQKLRERLLVGRDGARRLADYAGRGPLEKWLLACWLRALVDEARARKRELPVDDGFFDSLVAEGDLARVVQHRASREHCKVAFAEAIASLSSKERALLRLTYVNGLDLEGLSRLYGVHRSTAHRWLVEARNELGLRFRKVLAGRLGLSLLDVESVVRLVESRLELSLERLLRASNGDAR